MADVISVPTNEAICIKNECDDPEINVIALKLKKNFQKNTSATTTQLSTYPVDVYINRVGRAVILFIAPISQKNNQDKLPKDSEDIESINGIFSWNVIAGYHVPCITRVINVRSHFNTDSYANILNEINIKHCDVCYEKLQCNSTPSLSEKCCFICINSESVVLHCLKDGHKYVVFFYFEIKTENLRYRAVKLENWDLAYLKFCCIVQSNLT
ncbi:Uncharacterized protein FWK35_00025593 [Aphis craccivora]|uniref:Uncharacterized protein n=1 Tax=Aphis craccivora TaxID=307492 RepID=A0A6G0VTE8_APHCR|nr:Uncharacterized protein FWK35_00025593 [Aphis craccivora]